MRNAIVHESANAKARKRRVF